MTWSESDFFPAFKDAGMLTAAVYQPASGAPTTINVGFTQPDLLIMGDVTQSTEYEIEYETAALPNVAIGGTFTINSAAYKVRQPPEKQRDGFYSTVRLTKS